MPENLQKFFILTAVAAVIYLALTKCDNRNRVKPAAEEVQTYSKPLLPKNQKAEVPKEPLKLPESQGALPVKAGPAIKKISQQEEKPSDALKYVIDDGVAVVQGDLVVGEIVDDDGSPSGYVQSPSIKLWGSRIIPFYIQPNLQNPERVLRALEMFSGTAIQFVPYTDQQDVMVFEEATGVCKSYVGKVGGKQPLWIPPNCSPDDIAHEILHALGFVHEQNRTDRDKFIELFPDNIDEQYKDNFDRLPQELMKVSGLAPFDFESLMMYPPSMFSKNGQPTMRSRFQDKEIRPTEGLSPKDAERLNKAYSDAQ